MKLLVIGHTVVDRIITKQDEIIKPGGIYHTIIGLQSFTEDSDEIFLCTAVSDPNEDFFRDLYNKINKDFICIVDKIPEVTLNLYNDKERDESYSNINQNLKLPHVDFNLFDGILINMISGFDINLEQLKNLRAGYEGIIYFDVHSMARGVREDKKREFRLIPDFNEWATNIDILQSNEQEFKNISNKNSRIDVVRDLFQCGVKIIIITKGKEGARLFFSNRQRVESAYISALNVNSTNFVGCGDVFGAVFFYNYIRNRDIPESIKVANAAAGISTTYSQPVEYKNLKKDVLQRIS